MQHEVQDTQSFMIFSSSPLSEGHAVSFSLDLVFVMVVTAEHDLSLSVSLRTVLSMIRVHAA